jgi:23S rRNA (uracil1939-C5)-methyltransferase
MIARVSAIAKGGAGIVRDGERTIFVPGTIAGETVEYDLRGRLRSAWAGSLRRVLEASPQRVEPPCPHYGDCGGCNLQHMSYGEQLRSKAGILLANLKRIAGCEPAAAPPALASPPERYRSKVEFQVRGGAAGFFARASHRVVAIGGCLLLPTVMEEFFLGQRTRLAGSAQLQVVSDGGELAARLVGADGREAWLSRERTVRFAVGPLAYRFGPDNFIQANLFQLQPMLELLRGALAEAEAATAVDLFCGGGFFTLALARRFARVLAVESDARNLAALRANIALNRADNVQAVQADALRAQLAPADLVVVDPPRGGLSSRIISSIAGSGTRCVIYFSCDSATFARDLRLFCGHGFGLDDLRLIDNFPHSDHFEIFSTLRRAHG